MNFGRLKERGQQGANFATKGGGAAGIHDAMAMARMLQNLH